MIYLNSSKMTNSLIRIATRGSKLALYQAHRVEEELEKNFPDKSIEIKIIKTKGDKILDVALSKIGDKGLFTKELENSLLEGETDLAIHSLKDMPTMLPKGLMLGGVLERGEVRDALVSKNGNKLHELDETDVVATSSLRRKAQLLHLNPSLKIIDIRGNVETRLQKMKDGYCTAMVMAAAGIQRLGYQGSITEVIEADIIVPAVSLGAIDIEIRENDPVMKSIINKINHLTTLQAVIAERVFLNALEGGCQVPIGCYSRVSQNIFRITGFVSDLDGSLMLKGSLEGELSQAEEIARALAMQFCKKGALDIIHKIRDVNKI
jgi:hydroxymethylbilane synthase